MAVLRGLAREKKIGHTGTLDPMATGVLPVLLGRAAKALNFLPDTDKEYTAAFRLGERRDTGDITGQVVEESPAPVLPGGPGGRFARLPGGDFAGAAHVLRGVRGGQAPCTSWPAKAWRWSGRPGR